MDIWNKTQLLNGTLLTSLMLGTGFTAHAQSTIPVDDTAVIQLESAANEEADEDDDQIVVTGSRIKRSEFTSISPIQVVSGEVSRDLGLIEAGEILRQTTVVQGQQTTIGVSTVLQGGLGQAFTTFGSVTPSLRGLSSSVTGRSRNLILVNGRRLGPIGVGGAPSNPDVSLIPGSLISSVDLLLDGASSIYGSDAIAGVINYKLRTDVEGLEIDAFYDLADQVDSESLTLSATAGWQSDKGFALFAAEYRDTEGFRRIDRFNGGLIDRVETADFGSVACDPEREIDTNTGEIFSGCSSFLSDFAVFGPTGTTVVTPGQTNIGVDNFSRLGVAPFDGVDSIGTFGSINNPFTRSFPLDQEAHVNPPVERFSIYSLGEYETDLPTDLTAYYEASYAQRELSSTSFTQGVIEVTEDTPFNPGVGGTLLVPILQLDVDQTVDVFRATGGVKGNLDFLEGVGLDNWTYDAFALYHRSKGTQRNSGDISNVSAARVLNGTFDENDQFQCALDETLEGSQPSRGGPGGGFTTPIPNCFAVNFFDPQFLTTGRFSDQASNDFLLATAIQNTDIEQVTFNAFATGDLFDIPFGGTVQAVVGYEHRFDKVQTINDFNQSTSNALASTNPDVGSLGDRYINEYFGELIIPLIKDKPFINSLSVELAGRLIDEENFGSGETYQVKAQYEPLDWLQFSAGYGTSFRAPDTGESFGTGIIFAQNVRTDPCLPSTNVLNTVNGVVEYDGSFDERSGAVISLCSDLGVVLPEDGTSQATIDAASALGLFGIGTESGSFQNFSVLFGNDGFTDLTPETSRAFFGKVSIDQPWFDAFDLRLSANYYDYEVEDSIGQLTAGNILGSCFAQDPSDPTGNTPQSSVVNGVLVGNFCDFQTRNPDTGLLTAVNEASFNLGSITSRGVDINAEFFADLDKVGDFLGLAETPNFGLVYRATRSFENEEDLLGQGDFDDLLGEFGFPKLQQNITATVRYGNFGFLYSLQHQNATDTGVAPFGGGNVCGPTLRARGADDSGCTEFLELNDVELHNISVTYNADTWALRAGMRNVFNTVPVRDAGIPADGSTGTPFGLGYDGDGRNFFVNVSKRF